MRTSTPAPEPSGPIAASAGQFRDDYVEVEPAAVADRWQLPFALRDRGDLRQVEVVSRFGAGRRSYIPGHIHTAVDLVPRDPEEETIEVLAVAKGVVCSIHLTDPHTTVVVRHRTADGETVYSSYKHLAEVYVKRGQQVTEQTVLARLYTAAEARAFKGPYDHLHLEIRKRFDDYGVASWATMNREELRARFYDPLVFLHPRLRRGSR